MSEVLLRPAQASDIDGIYHLICELEQTELDYDAFGAGFSRNLDDKYTRYAVAEREGEIMGFISLNLQFHLHHARWIGEVQELVVNPAARGAGVGKKLLAWAEHQALEARAEQTELSTSTRRVDAHRFYQREGYRQSHFRFTKPL